VCAAQLHGRHGTVRCSARTEVWCVRTVCGRVSSTRCERRFGAQQSEDPMQALADMHDAPLFVTDVDEADNDATTAAAIAAADADDAMHLRCAITRVRSRVIAVTCLRCADDAHRHVAHPRRASRSQSAAASRSLAVAVRLRADSRSSCLGACCGDGSVVVLDCVVVAQVRTDPSRARRSRRLVPHAPRATISRRSAGETERSWCCCARRCVCSRW
jgi:hypothetical protein